MLKPNTTGIISLAARCDGAPPVLQVTLTDAERDVSESAAEGLILSPLFFSAAPSVGITHVGMGLCVARAFCRALGGELIAMRLRDESPSGLVLSARMPVLLPAAGSAHAHKRSAADEHSLAELSLKPAAKSSRTEPVTETVARILLVDDNALNVKLVGRLLEKAGCAVSTAVNGADALLALTSGTTPPPDLVLTDIQMPEMGGLELARRYRAWEACTRPGEHLPMVALSAASLDELTTEEVRDAGLGKCLRELNDVCLRFPYSALQTATCASRWWRRRCRSY